MSDSLGAVSVDVFANLSPMQRGFQSALTLSDSEGTKAGTVFGRRFGYAASRGLGGVTDSLQSLVQLGGRSAVTAGIFGTFIKIGKAASDAAGEFQRYKQGLMSIEVANGRIATASQTSEKALKSLYTTASKSRYNPEEVIRLNTFISARKGGVAAGAKETLTTVDAIEALNVKRTETDRFIRAYTYLVNSGAKHLDARHLSQLQSIAPAFYPQAAKVLGLKDTKDVGAKLRTLDSKGFEKLIHDIGILNKGLAETNASNIPSDASQNLFVDSWKLLIVPTGRLLNDNIILPLLKLGTGAVNGLVKANDATSGSLGLGVLTGLFVLGLKQASSAVASLLVATTNLSIAAERLAGVSGAAGFNPTNAKPNTIRQALQYQKEAQAFSVQRDSLAKANEETGAHVARVSEAERNVVRASNAKLDSVLKPGFIGPLRNEGVNPGTATPLLSKEVKPGVMKSLMANENFRAVAAIGIPMAVSAGLGAIADNQNSKGNTHSAGFFQAIATGAQIGGGLGAITLNPLIALGTTAVGGAIGGLQNVASNRNLMSQIGKDSIEDAKNATKSPLGALKQLYNLLSPLSFATSAYQATKELDKKDKEQQATAKATAETKFAEAVDKFDASLGKITTIVGNQGERSQQALTELQMRYVYSIGVRQATQGGMS